MAFEDVLISFPDAIPCGIKAASHGGKIILNPDDSYILQEGDEVLVIAEDDDSYSPTTVPMVLPFSLYLSTNIFIRKFVVFLLSCFFISSTTIIFLKTLTMPCSLPKELLKHTLVKLHLTT